MYYLQTQFSELRRKQISDVSGIKLGKISDFILTSNYKLSHFLLSESFLHDIEDKLTLQRKMRRPIVAVEQVSTAEDGVLKANISIDEITTWTKDKFTDHIRFEDLINVKIYDVDGRLTGRIIDAIIHIDLRISFILGGSPLEEFEERIGLIPDLDKFLPTSTIAHRESNRIELSIPKSKLAQKASRAAIKRGINFNRYPNIERHVFFRLINNMDDLKARVGYLEQKIAESKAAQDIVIKNVSKKSQLEIFVELYNQSFFASPDPVRELTIEEAERFDPDHLFIAYLAKLPVGFLYAPLELNNPKVGAIAGIGVLGTHRGRKIAYTLLKFAIIHFNKLGVEKVVCEIYEQNEPSRMMFESLGFEINGYMVLEEEQE